MEAEGVFWYGDAVLDVSMLMLGFFWCISLGIFLSLSYASDLLKGRS